MLVSSWISLIRVDLPLLILFWVSTSAFFLVTTVTMFTDLVRCEKVTSNTIYEGITVYLLLGLTWFALYNIAELLHPGSFRGLSQTDGIATPSSELLYFSFVTLSTTGYGDITPATPHVRSLAILEAVTGVLYIATFVARLVAAYRTD
jgi:hypothetical protein